MVLKFSLYFFNPSEFRPIRYWYLSYRFVFMTILSILLMILKFSLVFFHPSAMSKFVRKGVSNLALLANNNYGTLW